MQQKIVTLGDPHLGKKFETGVPLARRGERERSQYETLAVSLATPCDVHVCMGDLFDAFTVSNECLLATFDIYLNAASQNPQTTFYILRGNHDASRDSSRASSFEVLTTLLEGVNNICVVAACPFVDRAAGIVLFPWHPSKTAAEMINMAPMDLVGYTAYGHWDVTFVNPDNPNMIPTRELRMRGIASAVTGHEHLQADVTRDGVVIHITGSMQPYSFAEDPTGQLYVTLTLQEALADLPALKNKCVRIMLRPDDVLDVDIDCLQLKLVKVNADEKLFEDIAQVEFDSFDLSAIWKNIMRDHGVSEEISNLCWINYSEKVSAL